MTPELAAHNNARNVTRLHSVGVALPLGTMAVEELSVVQSNLLGRFTHAETTQRQRDRLFDDIVSVSGEFIRRAGIELPLR